MLETADGPRHNVDENPYSVLIKNFLPIRSRNLHADENMAENGMKKFIEALKALGGAEINRLPINKPNQIKCSVHPSPRGKKIAEPQPWNED